MIRTLSEICIDADNHCDDVEYLIRMCEELNPIRREYSLVDLKFMVEHLHGHIEKAREKRELLDTTGQLRRERIAREKQHDFIMAEIRWLASLLRSAGD